MMPVSLKGHGVSGSSHEVLEIVAEAVSGTEHGIHMTCFFRRFSREPYPPQQTVQSLHQKASQHIDQNTAAEYAEDCRKGAEEQAGNGIRFCGTEPFLPAVAEADIFMQ